MSESNASPSGAKGDAPADVAATAEPSLISRLIQGFQKTESGKDAVRTRRLFVGFGIGGFLTTNFLMFLRFFFPRTIFEPSTVFRIGTPTDFGFGVDTKFQKSNRIWVVKNTERLFVISAICTHLGCTPDWKQSEQKFKCPCHGSGYDPEGVNYEGPAPRPMDRARVLLDPEGQIIVDTSVAYKAEKGKQSQFDDAGAYIAI